MLSHLTPSTFLLFLRHAQTIWNTEQRYAGNLEVPLSPEASIQIRAITKRLESEPIKAIYTSPLHRCQETINPLAHHLHLKPIINQDLIERDLGEWQGKSSAELTAQHPEHRFPDSAYSGEFRIPEAETLEHLQTRVRATMDNIHSRHPGEMVLLSTHAGVIWILQKYLLNNPPPQPSWPGNCALYRVARVNNHYTLVESSQGL